VPRAAWHWGGGSSAANNPLVAPGSIPLYLCLPLVRLCGWWLLFPYYSWDSCGENKKPIKSRDAVVQKDLPSWAGELLNLSRNQLRIMTGLLTGHCHLKGHLFKLGLVNSPECNRCKQASETASHVLCDCEALTTLSFRHLGCHFMKPGDFENISVSKILHFVEGLGLLNEWAKGLHKNR
jgi:hypothetical protein